MRFSIITVCYNASGELVPTLQSIKHQTYRDFELIIVDGGSSDNTLELLHENRDIVNILVSERDEGIYDAMNKGIRLSNGEFIIFMNAGDWFVSPYTLATAASFIEFNPDVDVIFGGLEVRFINGKRTDYFVPKEESPIEFLVKGSLPHQATFARRRIFGRTGLFSNRYPVHADYEWFLKAVTDPTINVQSVPFIVASFGLGGQSSQSLNHERETHSIQNTFPLFQRPEWLRRRIEIYQNFVIELKS